MTLEEAIKIQQYYDNYLHGVCDEKLYNALKLGIEALKRRKEWCQGVGFNPDFMLPGETKD